MIAATCSGGAASGRLFLQTEAIDTTLPPSLAGGKADNQILAVVMHLQHLHPKRHVILVSKDNPTPTVTGSLASILMP